MNQTCARLLEWRPLALKLLLLGNSEITLSVVLTSLGEVRRVAPPRGANLALEDFGSEVTVTSLLARCGALFLAL